MNKYILTFVMFFVIMTSYSQTRKYYCEIKGTQKALSAGLKIIFDFGTSQVYSIWNTLSSKQKLVDENGEEIEFNSMVDAANYMVERGWEFQQAYSSAYDSQVVQHWIFYKVAESKEQAAEGLNTKETYKKNKK